MHFYHWSPKEKLQLPQWFSHFFSRKMQFHGIKNLPNEIFHNSPLSWIQYTNQSPLPTSYKINCGHSSKVVNINKDFKNLLEDSKFDAQFIYSNKNRDSSLFQNKTHLALRTADCLPISVHYFKEDIFMGALIHAGWRGLSEGIIEKTFYEMRTEFQAKLLGAVMASQVAGDHLVAKDFLHEVQVVVGPAIFGKDYECGEDVYQSLQTYKELYLCNKKKLFSEQKETNQEILEKLFPKPISTPNGHKIFPDLQMIASFSLLNLGLSSEQVHIIRHNTYGDAFFPSFRWACHFESTSACHGGMQKQEAKRGFWTHLTLPWSSSCATP